MKHKLFLNLMTLALVVASTDSMFYEEDPEYIMISESDSKKELLQKAEEYWEENDIPEDLRMYLTSL